MRRLILALTLLLAAPTVVRTALEGHRFYILYSDGSRAIVFQDSKVRVERCKKGQATGDEILVHLDACYRERHWKLWGPSWWRALNPYLRKS